MRAKKSDQDDAGLQGESASKRITPTDIQEKVFRQAKGPFRGYDEREVDAFLDQITEEVARLHAENKRLGEQAGQGGTGSRVISGPPPGGAVAFEGDPDLRDLTSSFISRERSFLQSLAGIIQQHAEAVKDDVRRARSVMAPSASSGAATGPGASTATGSAPSGAQSPAAESPRAADRSDQGQAAGMVDLTGAAGDMAPATVGWPAPKSAPARAEPPDDASIREMFWGEE